MGGERGGDEKGNKRRVGEKEGGKERGREVRVGNSGEEENLKIRREGVASGEEKESRR